MPLFYQQNINQHTQLAIWHITETENFFTQVVQPQRAIAHPQKRLQHLAGRFLLQQLHPSIQTGNIIHTPLQKPYVANNSDVHFSISHCASYAAVIVSKAAPVGIDIELETPKVVNIAPKFLHEQEFANWQMDVHKLTTQDIPLLTCLWSCKEAVFKWWGKGKVDFKNMIRLQPTPLQQVIEAKFKERLLPLQHQQFQQLHLSFIAPESV